VQTNTISYTDDGLGLQNFVETVSFNVDIKDPCKTSAFSAVSLSAMTVIVGQQATQDFSEAVDSAETTYGTDSCGARSYSVVLQGDATLTPVNYVTV